MQEDTNLLCHPARIRSEIKLSQDLQTEWSWQTLLHPGLEAGSSKSLSLHSPTHFTKYSSSSAHSWLRLYMNNPAMPLPPRK